MYNFKNTYRIFFSLAILLVSSILVAIGVDALYRNAYQLDEHWPQNILPAVNTGEAYELVVLGNSHSQSGVDFEKFNAKTLNLSSVAQRLSFDLAYLKHHSAQIKPDAVIIINASPISFSHAPPKPESGFHAAYYGRISPFFIPDLNWGDYLEQEFLSFTRSGFQWRQAYGNKIRERIAAEEKIRFGSAELPVSEVPVLQGSQEKNMMAPLQEQSVLAVDPDQQKYNVEYISQKLDAPESYPSEMTESVNFIFNKWYRTEEFSTDYFESNRRDLEEIIDFSQQQGWRPVVITVPISQELQDGLLDDYMQMYVYDHLSQADLKGVEYLDFSQDQRVAKNTHWFANSDHFNPEGAAAFSYVLLQRLIERGYVEKAVDGYDYGALYTVSGEK